MKDDQLSWSINALYASYGTRYTLYGDDRCHSVRVRAVRSFEILFILVY